MAMKYEDFIEVLREVSESKSLNSDNILKRVQDKLKERSDENGIDSAYTIVYNTFKSNSFYKNLRPIYVTCTINKKWLCDQAKETGINYIDSTPIAVCNKYHVSKEYDYEQVMILYNEIVSPAHNHHYEPFTLDKAYVADNHLFIKDQDFGTLGDFNEMFYKSDELV